MKLKISLALLVSVVLMAAVWVGCSSAPEPLPEPEPELPEVVVEPEPEPEPEPVFTVQGFIEQLRDALKTGTPWDALALYETLPEEYTDDYTLLYLKATILVSAQDYEAALELAGVLAERDPEDTNVTLLKMVLAKATGNNVQKQAAIKELLAQDPTNTDANTELGNEQMLKRNWQRANKYYLTALQGDSANLDALAGFGQSAYYLDNLKVAESTFNNMLKIDPQNGFAHSYLAKLAAEEENYALAIERMERALECEPDSYDYWVDYGTYLNHRNMHQKAIDAWTKAVELRPDYFLAYLYRGSLYDQTDKVPEALADYQMVCKLNPKYYFAYESMGVLAWGTGDMEEVRKWFSKALELQPTNKSYSMMIAASYYREGRTKDGKNYLSKTCLRQFPRDSVEYAVARLYYDNIAPSAVETKVMNTESINTRGKMLYYLGLYYDIHGNDQAAYKYYTGAVQLQVAQFFEYRLAEWAVKTDFSGVEWLGQKNALRSASGKSFWWGLPTSARKA